MLDQRTTRIKFSSSKYADVAPHQSFITRTGGTRCDRGKFSPCGMLVGRRFVTYNLREIVSAFDHQFMLMFEQVCGSCRRL